MEEAEVSGGLFHRQLQITQDLVAALQQQQMLAGGHIGAAVVCLG